MAGEPEVTTLQERIAQLVATLAPAERKVADYLRNNLSEVMFASAERIGELTGTSDATVVRTAKALGYSGLPELKRQVGRTTSQSTPPAMRLRRRIEQSGGAPDTILDRVFSEAAERVEETHRLTDVAEFDRAAELLFAAREVFTFGIGPSGLVAHYLARRLVRLGRAARSTEHTGFRLADELLPLRRDDAVVVYSPGRTLTDIEVIIDHAASVGAACVLVTDSLAPVYGDRVDSCLPASHSASGFTGELLSALVVTDALVLSVAAHDESTATTTSDLLTDLRTQLVGSQAKAKLPGKRRTPRQRKDR